MSALTPEAARLVNALGLAPHPEGGFYRETWRSPLSVAPVPGAPPEGSESSSAGGAGSGAEPQRNRERAASTAIYFLLPAGAFSAFHRVSSDEVWHHYDGDPLELHLLDDDGSHRVVVLGRAIAEGERPQAVVPAGVWQAAVPRGARFALSGCTVAPGFDFADFEMPPREAMLARFPGHADLVTRLTRP